MSNETKKRTGWSLGIVVALLVGLWAWYSSRFENTDNAYVSAHVATLSAKVPGLVTAVYVEENQKVVKGQVLAQIDPRDYQNALNQQQAQLKSVEASLALAKKDERRARELYAEDAVSAQFRDAAVAKEEELDDQRQSLSAQISQSQLNLGFTQLVAPEDGTVGEKSIEPGMVVAEGQPLMAFVDAQAPWVDANFKETQLRDIRVGQKAEVQIDSIAGKKFAAVVESVSPGTGAVFALIPPDNATGNFTKIVQRVPVRLRFDTASLAGFRDRIVPGLSVEATVFVK